MKNINELKIGDIFSFYLKRWGFYVSAQIVLKDDKKGTIAIVLNALTKEVPTLDALKNAKYFVFDHHYWQKKNFYINGDTLLAFNPILIGNTPLIDTPPDGYISTETMEQFSLQYQWNRLPEDFKKHFKAKKPQNTKLKITANKSKDFYTNALKENPLLYKIESSIFDAELQSFLKEKQQVSELELKGTDKAVVDVSTSGTNSLSIHNSNIDKIVLNSYMQSISLFGDFSTLKEIVCPFEGELLNLCLYDFNSGYLKFKGLHNLRELRIFSAKKLCVDIEEIVNTFPYLEYLMISGKNAFLKNIEALAKLKYLESVWLSDLYGFDSFVKKTEIPKLNSITLWSVPKVVADKVKKEFKSIDELEIKQARTDEWIKANLDNPLGEWDGREGTKLSVAKKAMKAYTDAYKKLSSNQDKNEAAKTLQNFIVIFNQIDEKHPIDTLEREEIWDAFNILGELTLLTVKEKEQIFEDLRDF